ncbi:MAG TPA: cysteine peptidase family C39 domain-containing protein [Stellaceae bacterium]|jgi:ABC-type bacteriocin/lantibiotic exporter with double-glycine peptidase domain|nr:cysteine peptidase family C39 domain-containing protein [Stellaceae bacterium]
MPAQYRQRKFWRGAVTPQVRQAEATECGIAALAIVMGHHGVHVPLETLRAHAGSTRLGLSARRLLGIARDFGFTAKGFSCDIDEIAEIGLPLIAHFRFSHYLVVERIGSHRVRVNDPFDGPRSLPIEEFSQGFTGIVLRLAPTPGLEPRGRAFSAWRELALRLRPVVSRLVLAGSLSTGSAFCLTVASGIGGIAFDRLAADRPAFGLIALTAIAATAALALAVGAESVAVQAGGIAAWRQASGALRRLARLPESYFANRLPANRIAKMQATLAFADAPAAVAATQLPALAVFATAFWWFGGWIGVAVVALAAAEFAVIVKGASWRGRVSPVDNAQLPVIAPSSTLLGAPESWHVGDGGHELFSRLARIHAFAMATALPAAEMQAALDAARALLRTTRLLGVLVSVAVLVPAGAIALGAAVALVSVGLATDAVLDRFADGFAPARLRRALHDLADLSNAVPMRRAAQPRSQQAPQAGHLTLSDVTWAPDPLAQPVVEKVSIDLPAGAALAICGPSGSGKSVLARLVTGDLVPSTGTVKIGGVTTPAAALLVDKRPGFIDASVRDNLCLGRRIADPALAGLLDAVDIADAFAPRGGLDLVLTGEGREFAGSERYRLAVARALLCRPAVLVLDDFFDGLEPTLAGRICGVVRDHGVTLVAIGRRQPPEAMFDRVLVLPAGPAT